MSRATSLAAKEKGNAAFRNGDMDQAIIYYTEAITIDPSEHTFFSNRSAAYHGAKKFKKAIEDAQMCIQLKNDWPKGYYRLGEGYYGLGLFAKAVDAYSKALGFDPSDEGIREALAKAERALTMRLNDEDDECIAEERNIFQSHTRARKAEEANTSTASANTSGTRVDPSRHSEIMARCFSAGPGITSMDDYKRFKAAGGAKVPESAEVSAFIATQLPDAAGAGNSLNRRADFLRSLGIQMPTSAASSSSSGSSLENSVSNSKSEVPVAAEAQKDGSFLMRKRAELMSMVKQSAGESGLSGDWAKIRGSDLADIDEGTPKASSSGSAERRENANFNNSPPTDFASTMTSERRGESAASQRSLTREEFMATLDSVSAPSVVSYGRRSTASNDLGGDPDSTRYPLRPISASTGSNQPTPKAADSKIDRRRDPMDSLPDVRRTSSGLGATSSSAVPPRRPPLAHHNDHVVAKGKGALIVAAAASGEDGAEVVKEVDTEALAREALESSTVSSNHPLFASLRRKSEPAFDYSAAGIKNVGEEEKRIMSNWMLDYRTKAQQQTGSSSRPPSAPNSSSFSKQPFPTATTTVGGRALPGLAAAEGGSSGFQYRKYKETSNDDEVTKTTTVGRAIMAESLQGYNYAEFAPK